MSAYHGQTAMSAEKAVVDSGLSSGAFCEMKKAPDRNLARLAHAEAPSRE